jgi:predicted RecB family nuclease
MQLTGDGLLLSATDLAQHLGCRHLTQLDRAAVEKRITAPMWKDPLLEVLKERGLKHEAAYEEHLAAGGLSVAHVGQGASPDQVRELMRAGTDVLVQVPLSDGRFRGIADFLRRVEQGSELGPFSYEVIDAKLAQETRAGTILQLGLYSELVARIQGRRSDYMHVVKPGEGFQPETFRVADFDAYFRLIKARLDAVSVSPPDESTYPTPVAQCDICRWWQTCDSRRRDDDHLCLVAGMSTLHAAEFQRQGITTLTQLGEAAQALPERPDRGNLDAFDRLHQQARIQLEGQRAGGLRHELLPLQEARGLQRLPEPSPGDIFFDLEAARFYDDGGLEYLFGWCTIGDDRQLDYHRVWADDRNGERHAFEQFIDAAMKQWQLHDGMHIYHFAPYEPSALKRLLGRHGRCEVAVDRLLRGKRLVDLHGVARQGIRASVEQYSLKDLELLAGFKREVDLREATRARRRIEAGLEASDFDGITESDRATVEGYNREDCEATAALRDWLELRRQEWTDRGSAVARPELLSGEAPEAVAERQAEVQAVYDALTQGLPEDRDSWTAPHKATWLLAEMLDYHRREMNCSHWEFFRQHDLDEMDLLDERKALTGLQFVGVEGGTAQCPVHRYQYPDQEAAFDPSDKLYEAGQIEKDLGEVAAFDPAACTIDIKKRKRTASMHPGSVVVDDRVAPWEKAASLLELARSVAENGVDGDGPFRAARDLLLKHPPRRRGNPSGPLRGASEDLLHASVRVAMELEGGLLPMQGPPGSGKTFTGARMIVQLAKMGKCVGVTAVSHKVIRNLIDEVRDAAAESKDTVRLAQKISSKATPVEGDVLEVKKNAEAFAALADGHVLGGTAWLWSSDDAVESLDYLFVDEAGQMAIADVLAVGRAAHNIVLLGDPQQLEQPQQASHPEGTEVAALVHILDGAKTIPEHKGLFLDTTWRLNPAICQFTSELYYEGRLQPKEGNQAQVLAGATRFSGSGLFLVPVEHEGNQSSAPEEVEAIQRVVADLLQQGVMWTSRKRETKPLTANDILIVAPYNAQTAALKRALPGMRIGTVDKFQGQEAPVVIYSMTSSSPEDAPRGLSFLYNPNRLNVATSRARCAVVLVANKRLLEPQCHSPDQMRWANGLCRFRELANEVVL